jgi:exonuclease SbcC
LAAQFSEKIDNDLIPIASGERKQFGESMTAEVEKKLGINFEKLKVASIVQQGELNSIIKAEPKEFKELLNAIIGFDKLDVAYEVMKTIHKEFRNKIKEKIGYDDTNIDILKRELENFKIQLKEAIPLKEELTLTREKFAREVSQLRKKWEIEAPKLDKLNQLETRKNELTSHCMEVIKENRRKITEKEQKIQACEGCFDFAEKKLELKNNLEKTESIINRINEKLEKLSIQKASIKEKQILAEKLQLKDNKCPVCDSKVDKLNPLFQVEHLEKELVNTQKEIQSFSKEKDLHTKSRESFSEQFDKSKDASVTLRTYSIKNRDDIERLKEEINQNKINVQKIPSNITVGNLIEIATIDSHTKTLCNTISQLEQETKGFDAIEFSQLKTQIDEKQSELSTLDRQLGAVIDRTNQAEEKIKILNSTLGELEIVKNYVENLEQIQNKVFNRDGSVATSLRSWALTTISAKASEYLTLLNTKIQRILLEEKSKKIHTTCYSKNEVLALESLSGGEQVSVALSLRLGIASLLGASNLNLMILDEPTAHLDTERRKALVGVLSQLSNITNAGAPMQFIIITHDSEIFDDSTVEQIYKFEATEDGTSITFL